MLFASWRLRVLKKALALQPKVLPDGKKLSPQEQIREDVKISGLRGRGGAGFSCGLKWSFVDRKSGKPIYLICNADESEPGTFKDRQIMYKDPHQLLEGMIISCFANDVHLAYIYIRGEMVDGAKILNEALPRRAKGFLGKKILGSGYDLEIYVHRGAGAYICGEETGLIESLEGKRAYPRIKPPYFPAVLGLYMCPTIVNNVETLCNVKHIVAMGGAAFAKLGTPNNTGTRIVSVSGHVEETGLLRNRGRQGSPSASSSTTLNSAAVCAPAKIEGRHSRRFLRQSFQGGREIQAQEKGRRGQGNRSRPTCWTCLTISIRSPPPAA
jgi:NADH-quinone oxidoreductase subunit F